MKTLLTVYAVSWLISLAVYLYFQYKRARYKKKHPLPGYAMNVVIKSKKQPWYSYALFLAIAPLGVLFLPYVVISSLKEDKFISSHIVDKKKAREYKKFEQELEQRKWDEYGYRQQAMQDFEDALDMPQEDHSEAHIATARSLKRLIAAKDYDAFMSCLDHLSLPDGVSLHVEAYSQNGSGDASKLFVQKTDGTHDYKIWDYIKVANSINGAWEACLLSKIWHLLPLWWHANYDERTYLYSVEDADNIHLYSDEEQNASLIREIVRPLISAPEVVKAKDRFYVRCRYWTNFGGVIQETTEVLISPEGKASFKDIEREALYEYNCGIMF